MNLTILGKSPAMPDANGANSGYLVRHEDFTLLIDCGSGVFAKLRALADVRAVDAVLITHIHADHTSDLIAYAHALAHRLGLEQPPALWGPPGSEGAFAALGGVFGHETLIGSAFDEHEYDPGQALRLGPLTVTFAPVPHYVPAWACDVRAPDGRRLTFGADCGPNDAIVSLAAGSDLLMLEATEGPWAPPQPSDQESGFRGHISAQEAGEIASAAAARRLLLTHFSDELDASELLQAAQGAFSGEVLLAHEGLSLTI